MPRHLPWKTPNETSTATTTQKPAKTTQKPPAPPPPKRARTACTPPSPHASDIRSSDLESMHSSDDGYMMVEDELQSTAQLFTRSIRQKEYARLRLGEKRAPRIDDIQRPVVAASGSTEESLGRRRREAKARVQLKRRTPEDDEDDDEDGEGLEALMRGLHRQESTLVGLGVEPGAVKTRAAAGFKGSWRPELRKGERCKERYERAEETDDDDDDLGAPVVRKVKPAPAPRSTVGPSPATSRPTPSTSTNRTSASTATNNTSISKPPTAAKPFASSSRPIIESSGPDFFSLDSVPESNRFRRRGRQKEVDVKTEEKRDDGDFIKRILSL